MTDAELIKKIRRISPKQTEVKIFGYLNAIIAIAIEETRKHDTVAFVEEVETIVKSEEFEPIKTDVVGEAVKRMVQEIWRQRYDDYEHTLCIDHDPDNPDVIEITGEFNLRKLAAAAFNAPDKAEPYDEKV